MKKVLIVLVLFIMVFSYISASVDSGNVNFNVHWVVSNIKTTTIYVVPYSGTGTLPQDMDEHYLKDIAPNSNSTLCNVCLIKYVTNVKGTHKIEFSATPMKKSDGSKLHAYDLYITYGNGFPSILDVDPNEDDNSKLVQFTVIGSGETTAKIYLDAVLTDWDEMFKGDYSSLVTIARITE